MTTPHPYSDIADYRHWRRAPGVEDPAALDPVAAPKFTIGRDEAVATAGSCFAQHVMRHLAASGFNTLVAEEAPAIHRTNGGAHFHYGVFSTRSGNVYTARQLRQLFARAAGEFVPETNAWETAEGFIDPFRPSVGPFLSLAELEADRAYHLSRVRAMMADLSVFVFTLGLTEGWMDRDGAVFPLAPGVSGGTYDPARHTMKNFTVDETVADMRAALAALRAVNPAARVILTVSPVPLMATAEDRHVLASTTYSKAVLRVAAQMLSDADERVDYFPSYEIITAPQVRGRYYGPDARAVTEAGVSHVMGVFLKHYGGIVAADVPGHDPAAGVQDRTHLDKTEEIVEVLCDEEALDAPRASRRAQKTGRQQDDARKPRKPEARPAAESTRDPRELRRIRRERRSKA
ncbi:GSCFA domain-containing protein [Acuticoccus sp. MNP-M23]|uniref:GSCFA domain-containing protein n=1 Tax=Acuticoccus sp. MNP-M23 TaxID=3072793 RepID=UPI0028164236|nr:GSCFA domain-containing protein [Acuticoccus sp. MNP-M23]WMS43685.1 GSCFA domain-containing protein [Acuticoccus sp. MNP-M23]